jgi:hypothetical protein
MLNELNRDPTVSTYFWLNLTYLSERAQLSQKLDFSQRQDESDSSFSRDEVQPLTG